MPKRKLTLWVNEQTDKQVRDLAAMHGLTISELASAHLEKAMMHKAETLGLDLLGPLIEGAIRREVGHMGTRLARLLARTALEAAAGRRLAFNVLLQQGINPQDAKQISELAWQRSVEALRKPLIELETLVKSMGEKSNDVNDRGQS